VCSVKREEMGKSLNIRPRFAEAGEEPIASRRIQRLLTVSVVMLDFVNTMLVFVGYKSICSNK